MRVDHAQDVAARWVHDVGSATPGFVGAYLHGGITWLPDDAELLPTSDVDLILALDGPRTDGRSDLHLGKRPVDGLLLDVSALHMDDLRPAERVLRRAPLAGSLARTRVLADRTGELTAIQAAVADGYPRRRWVRARLDETRDRILTAFPHDAGAPWPAQVTAWLFPTGILCHLPLVAALRNPTVRTRYLAARSVLADYGHADLYPALLDLLGCAGWTAAQTTHHLDAVAEMFDQAARVVRSPFPFARDLSPEGRPIAIDGSRALIAQGDHREAVFWLVATACRCQLVLAVDAPELAPHHAPAFAALLADLGIHDGAGHRHADLAARRAATEALLPTVMATAHAILAANAEVLDDVTDVPSPSDGGT